MSIFSDTTIKTFAENGGIEGYISNNVSPASYDVTLSDSFVEYVSDGVIDIADKNGLEVQSVDIDEEGSIIIPPRGFVIGSTQEVFHFTRDMAGDISGRSSLGRLGLQVHPVAGWIDPGFNGSLTLPIFNMSPHPLKVTAGTRVAQVVFYNLDTAAEVSYDERTGSKYNNQSGPTTSRFAEDGGL